MTRVIPIPPLRERDLTQVANA
ncbi:MAG: hypothetical protein QOI22_1784, partial [Verrucomicrobiota bacterium]